ncbi:MAG: hypothetical protein AB1512_04180 [Thermodesulfobacteriota bacterium]
MNEQLSLFVDENTLFNKALERLLDMDFSGGQAARLFVYWFRLVVGFPVRD